MDKRQTDRLSVNYRRTELMNKIVDKWIERMIRSIQYQDKDTHNAPQAVK